MAAQTPLTVAGMYDTIRRMLELVPGIDLPTPLASGVPAPSQPDPNNQTILDALNYAIDWVNRKIRCGPIVWIGSPISVSVTTQNNGGQPVAIDTDDANTFLIREVNDAVWSWSATVNGVSTTLYRRLEPINYSAMAAASAAFAQEVAAPQPQRFFISGVTAVLFPAPTIAGNLILMQTEGINELVSTSDTIVGPPVSLHSTIYFKAVSILSARLGSNVESAQREALFDGFAADGLGDIAAWKQGFDPTLIDVLRDSSRMIAAGEQQRRGGSGQRGPGT